MSLRFRFALCHPSGLITYTYNTDDAVTCYECCKNSIFRCVVNAADINTDKSCQPTSTNIQVNNMTSGSLACPCLASPPTVQFVEALTTNTIGYRGNTSQWVCQ